MREKFGRFTQQLSYLPAALRIVWQSAPLWTTFWAILLLSQGILPVATVYLTRSVVNSLSDALNNEGEALSKALLYISLLALTMLASELFKGLQRWVQTAQSEQVIDHIKGLIHEKAISLDLAYYETPAYYDMLHRARNDAASKPLTLVQNLGSLIQNSITLIAMAGILLPFGAWIPLALLVGTLPAIVVVLRVNLRMHAWQYKRAPMQRRVQYYDWMLTNAQAAPELRLFAFGPLFIKRFQAALAQLRTERLSFVRQESATELFAATLGLLTLGITLGVLTWQTVTIGGSLGDLALFYQAFSQGQRLMRTLLGSVGQIYQTLLFLENLFAFLRLESTLLEPRMPSEKVITLKQSIVLHNVSFRYPASDREALTNFSLTIPAGKIVAIVGENGAGKSTLLKLITRLYDPTAGHITLDGQNLRDLPLAELRRLFTILFQVPVPYQQTVMENITLGDWVQEPDPLAVQAAAVEAGADKPIQRLPKKYDELLGKSFGGSELSVGEWQRIALARAFYRKAEVIILDEPTSAMDSWAESAWLERFKALAAGKTAVVITHRFTTAMCADIIYVMVEGHIIESGTHDELLQQNGHYATSWRKQTTQSG
ncbi:MAG: ABC transporter ATP-binding protein [Candidatus Promineifilaceae bacterium]